MLEVIIQLHANVISQHLYRAINNLTTACSERRFYGRKLAVMKGDLKTISEHIISQMYVQNMPLFILCWFPLAQLWAKSHKILESPTTTSDKHPQKCCFHSNTHKPRRDGFTIVKRFVIFFPDNTFLTPGLPQNISNESQVFADECIKEIHTEISRDPIYL